MALPYATEDQLKQLKTQLANIGNKSVKTKEELDALKGTDGQLVYCQGDSKLYIFKKDKWEEVGGGGSKVGIVDLTNEQCNGYQNNSFTLTDEQFNIIKNNDYIIINSTIAISETETVNISELYNKTYLSQNFNGEVAAFYGLINCFNDTIRILTVQDKNASIVIFKNVDNYVSDISINYNNFNVLKHSDTSNDEYYYMMYINHKPVISKEAVSIDLPEAKVISFLGNHSILVPKDSTDTNIELYRHEINMSNNNNEKIYFTYYSSSNLVIDSFTDLNTLLGSKFRDFVCNGILKDGNTVYNIFSIGWRGLYSSSTFTYSKLDENGNAEFTSLSRFTNIIDIVTTI